MAQQRSPKQLAKFLTYILGHKPDEFGLVLNPDGFVKIKELLKAVCEESGWKHVRKQHIDEILVTLPKPEIEVKDKYIRATCRDKIPRHALAENLPKLLYTCVRNKAYPFVREKGIFPLGYPRVILSSSLDMAQRMGKRIDRAPVILTTLVQKSLTKGVVFYEAGDSLYLAESIPVECFTGPPLPKQKPAPATKDTPLDQKPRQPAGSFLMDLNKKSGNKKSADRNRGKETDTQVKFKKGKKNKQKRERPPWRA